MFGGLHLPNNITKTNNPKANGTVAFSSKGNCAVVITVETVSLKLTAIGNGELVVVQGLAFNRNDQQAHFRLYFAVKSKVHVYVFF
jgi:hypothetical protein